MSNSEKNSVKISVPSKDPKKPQDLEPKDPDKLIRDDNTGPVEESEEDRLLREKLEAAAEKILSGKKDQKTKMKALSTMANEIKTATSSMTSVPKPLKFLRKFYEGLKKVYFENFGDNVKTKSTDKEFKTVLADVLSVLAMTMAKEGSREMLFFKMEGNRTALGEWGHEFVRALCGEISQEFTYLSTNPNLNERDVEAKKADLIALAQNIVPFMIRQNTETEAVDLLFEVDQLKFLTRNKIIDKSNYERTCLYLMKFAEFLFEKKDLDVVLGVAFELYLNCDDLPMALTVAMKLQDKEKIQIVFKSKYGESAAENTLMKKQLAYMLAEHRCFIYEDSDEELNDLINNTQLCENFQTLSLSLNMQDPKSPEDVYKTHLEESPYGLSNVQAESARNNLAKSYVNAFVNCGFRKDALLEKPTDTANNAAVSANNNETNWVFRNKEYGKTGAVASLGLINLWSVDIGSNLLSPWVEADQSDIHCLAGGLLGLGVTTAGVKDTAETAFALISDVFSSQSAERKNDKMVKICAILGLGLAHAGNPTDEAQAFVMDRLNDEAETSLDVRAFATLALGLMHVGTGDGQVAAEITETIFSIDDEDLNQPVSRFFALALALIFMGQQEETFVHLAAIEAIENKSFAKLTTVLVEACAYAGSGNVIEVQKLLHICAEPQETAKEPDDATSPNQNAGTNNAEADKKVKEELAQKAVHQSVAVIGVALITFAESVGRQMAERTFQHLLQYGDLAIRRAVPLAIALSHISDPDYGLVDLMSRLTHDGDKSTAMCAILGLGLMSAGTTNSRVALLLRQLATFYQNETNILFVVRLAQGLLFAGKGLVTFHPFHADRTLLSYTSIAGLLTVIVSCFDLKQSLLSEYHILMFALSCCIRPRMALTLCTSENNSDLENTKVRVRVGQAVETVGQAGNPKKITGFQNQETPVLLNVGDRAEVAGDDFQPFTNVLEGIVIVKRMPKEEDK